MERRYNHIPAVALVKEAIERKGKLEFSKTDNRAVIIVIPENDPREAVRSRLAIFACGDYIEDTDSGQVLVNEKTIRVLREMNLRYQPAA